MSDESGGPLKFERKISLDTVLVLLGMLIAGIAFWNKLDARLVIVENRSTDNNVIISKIADNNMKISENNARLSALVQRLEAEMNDLVNMELDYPKGRKK